MLYPCMLCVVLSIDLFVLCVACLTVFFNCLIGCCCYFVVECYGGVLLDRPCMLFQRVCVLCL